MEGLWISGSNNAPESKYIYSMFERDLVVGSSIERRQNGRREGEGEGGGRRRVRKSSKAVYILSTRITVQC